MRKAFENIMFKCPTCNKKDIPIKYDELHGGKCMENQNEEEKA